MDLFSKKLYSHESEALSPMNKIPPTSLFQSHSHSSHAGFPIIAVAIIGILATAFLLVGYYVFVIKCCLNWHRIDVLQRFSFSRRRRVEDPLMVHSPVIENRGLDDAAIRSIPIFQFKKKEDFESRESKSCECAVCLNEFQENEKLRMIPNCGHVFHIDCIDVWLQNNANCPLCRTSISATKPDITRFPLLDQILWPGPNPSPINPSPQDPSPNHSGSFTGRDEDYVVIEIGSEQSPSLIRNQENLNSSEISIPVGSLGKKLETKKKTLSNVSSMGDECIDNRKKDLQFAVQPIRRSFSMDSAADGQLYLAVQEIIEMQRHVICEVSTSEGCSRFRKSFFSFGHSRSAVQPVSSET